MHRRRWLRPPHTQLSGSRLGVWLVRAGRLLRGAVLIACVVVVAWSVIAGLLQLPDGNLTQREALAHFLLYPIGAAVVAGLGALFGATLVVIGENLIARRLAMADEAVLGPEPARDLGRLPRPAEGRRTFPEISFTVLLAAFALAVNAAVIGTFSGVVREQCLDTGASKRTGGVEIDSHWTYIVWPPLMFAANDPHGRCVRTNPARVALDHLGIWPLPSPELQVRKHIADQLQNGTGG
jgi:hypothetical protein